MVPHDQDGYDIQLGEIAEGQPLRRDRPRRRTRREILVPVVHERGCHGEEAVPVRGGELTR